ncbi:fungal hydrophobin [Xylaria sp. FL0043]|nr:fungal hydrophobin [Xylaria sp. FL0043]
MQLTTLFVSLLATAVVASPTKRNGGGGGGGTPYDACPDGLYSVPQCCATDVLGVADLDCASPTAVLTSPTEFEATCALGGARARCCVVPVLGQSLLCETPVGL